MNYNIQFIKHIISSISKTLLGVFLVSVSLHLPGCVFDSEAIDRNGDTESCTSSVGSPTEPVTLNDQVSISTPDTSVWKITFITSVRLKVA